MLNKRKLKGGNAEANEDERAGGPSAGDRTAEDELAVEERALDERAVDAYAEDERSVNEQGVTSKVWAYVVSMRVWRSSAARTSKRSRALWRA